MGDEARVMLGQGRKGPHKPKPYFDTPLLPCHGALPSGDEMVEERGVPVHEDWSMAPDDDRVKFSLSGVAPHSWKKNPWGGRDGGH